jgi:hypothetical protein
MLAGVVYHLAEAGTAGLLGGFHVHVLFDDPDALGQRVVPQQLELGGYGKVFLLLILGRYPRINHGVRGNMRAMEAVRHFVIRAWRFWLNRRSSKKAMPWEKLAKWLGSHEEKIGARGCPIKSNVTDNDSAALIITPATLPIDHDILCVTD